MESQDNVQYGFLFILDSFFSAFQPHNLRIDGVCLFSLYFNTWCVGEMHPPLSDAFALSTSLLCQDSLIEL